MKALVGLGIIGAAVYLNRSGRGTSLLGLKRNGIPDDLYDLFEKYVDASNELVKVHSNYSHEAFYRAVRTFQRKWERKDIVGNPVYEADLDRLKKELLGLCRNATLSYRTMRDVYDKKVKPISRHPDFGKMVKAIENGANDEDLDWLQRARHEINSATSTLIKRPKWWAEKKEKEDGWSDVPSFSCEEIAGPWNLPPLAGLREPSKR